MGSDVFVEILGLDLVGQAVRVGEEQPGVVAIRLPDESVVEVIHQDLRDIQDVCSQVDGLIELQLRLLHMDDYQALGEDDPTIEVGLGHELQRLLSGGDQPVIDPLADIFHILAEDRIIPSLKKSYSESDFATALSEVFLSM